MIVEKSHCCACNVKVYLKDCWDWTATDRDVHSYWCSAPWREGPALCMGGKWVGVGGSQKVTHWQENTATKCKTDNNQSINHRRGRQCHHPGGRSVSIYQANTDILLVSH